MASLPPQSGVLPPALADYWLESRQPLTALVFVTPVLLFYELGVVLLGPRAIRNGADVWLRGFLDLMDLGQYFLLPILTVCILLGWHYTTRRPWRVSRAVLSGMAVECALLACCLRLVLHLEVFFWEAATGPVAAMNHQVSIAANASQTLAGMIGFLGAGVYEELLFRLILLSFVAWSLKRIGHAEQAGTVGAIVLTSFIFSAAHYVGPCGEPVLWGQFTFWFGALFRFLAGVFFSVLFVYRGFGIAVGAHAGYDILVRLL
jgi:membrane protease YdiL (CAAX protease family)